MVCWRYIFSFLESSSLCSQYVLYFWASLSFPLEGTAHSVSFFQLFFFFWTCVTRKKEKPCNIRVFPEKGSDTHIWLTLVLFRRRKSGGLGLGFVCAAFFFGLSYHTQAQRRPLELTRRLWIVLALLMQWVFSSCIAGKACSLFCLRTVKEESLRAWSSLVPTWYHKVQNYQGIGVCLISVSWQEMQQDWGFCLRQCTPSGVSARISHSKCTLKAQMSTGEAVQVSMN